MHVMIRVSIFFPLVLFFLCVNAQEKAFVYRPLKSAGPIPPDFLLSYDETYQRKIRECEKNGAGICPESHQVFYQRDLYFMHEMLTSGMILFNDPVSNYVHTVADRLLAARPDLRSRLRFYTVKSPTPNAFSSQSGIILVNVGLLAQLENEAQLAFVLSHEIAHYQLDHPLKLALEYQQQPMATPLGADPPSLDELLQSRQIYSRSLELEADSVGMELYLTSSYPAHEIMQCMEVLKRIEQQNTFAPFTLSPASFSSIPVTIPGDYFQLPQEVHFSLPGDESHPSLGHPNPIVRKSRLQGYLSSQMSLRKPKTLTNSTAFQYIQTLSRYECCRMFVLKRAYAQAINFILPLRELYPQDPFLKKLLGHSWYGLAKYALAGKLWDVHTTYEEIQGEPKEIFYFIEQLQTDELLELAMWYNWKLVETYPQDYSVKAILQDLLLEWLFLRRDQRLNKGREDTLSTYQFTAITHKNFQQTPSFRLWETQIQALIPAADSLLAKQALESHAEIQDSEAQFRLAEEGFNLGLERVVFVEPTIQINGGRAGNNIQYQQTLEARVALREMIERHATSIGLSHRILSMQTLSADKVDEFNDIALLTEWYAEKNSHGDLNIVSIFQDSLFRFQQKYHTPHFAWTGLISYSHPRTSRGLLLFAGALLPVLLPYSLYYRKSDTHGTFLYSAVCDFQDGGYLVQFPKMLRMKARKDILNSLIFDLVFQIHQAPKPE